LVGCGYLSEMEAAALAPAAGGRGGAREWVEETHSPRGLGSGRWSPSRSATWTTSPPSRGTPPPGAPPLPTAIRSSKISTRPFYPKFQTLLAPIRMSPGNTARYLPPSRIHTPRPSEIPEQRTGRLQFRGLSEGVPCPRRPCRTCGCSRSPTTPRPRPIPPFFPLCPPPAPCWRGAAFSPPHAVQSRQRLNTYTRPHRCSQGTFEGGNEPPSETVFIVWSQTLGLPFPTITRNAANGCRGLFPIGPPLSPGSARRPPSTSARSPCSPCTGGHTRLSHCGISPFPHPLMPMCWLTGTIFDTIVTIVAPQLRNLQKFSSSEPIY